MKVLKILFALALLGATFAGGYIARGTRHTQPERRVLYWVDPMHPQYKSDKPGIAPSTTALRPAWETPAGAKR